MKTFFKKLIFFVCFFLIGILFVACSNLPGGSSSEPNNPTNPPSSSEKEDNGEHVCNFKLMKEVPLSSLILYTFPYVVLIRN